jgi:phage terminase small subunit
MGLRGPSPQTADSLKLSGAYRPDRHADRANIPAAAGVPTRPRDLKPAARAFWDAVVGDLVANGTAKRLDTSMLRAAAEFWGLYRAALKLAEKSPTEKNVRCAVTGYFAAWDRAATKLGLSPADRTRIRLILDTGSVKPSRVPVRDRGPTVFRPA